MHSLTFEGSGSGSADVTAFVDDVSLVSSTPEPSLLPFVGDMQIPVSATTSAAATEPELIAAD